MQKQTCSWPLELSMSTRIKSLSHSSLVEMNWRTTVVAAVSSSLAARVNPNRSSKVDPIVIVSCYWDRYRRFVLPVDRFYGVLRMFAGKAMRKATKRVSTRKSGVNSTGGLVRTSFGSFGRYPKGMGQK